MAVEAKKEMKWSDYADLTNYSVLVALPATKAMTGGKQNLKDPVIGFAASVAASNAYKVLDENKSILTKESHPVVSGLFYAGIKSAMGSSNFGHNFLVGTTSQAAACGVFGGPLQKSYDIGKGWLK